MQQTGQVFSLMLLCLLWKRIPDFFLRQRLHDAIQNGFTSDEYNHLRVEFPVWFKTLFNEQRSGRSHDITRTLATVGTCIF